MRVGSGLWSFSISCGHRVCDEAEAESVRKMRDGVAPRGTHPGPDSEPSDQGSFA